VLKWVFTARKHPKLPATRFNKLSGVYRGSIVWGYFIRKKKHFSEFVRAKQ